MTTALVSAEPRLPPNSLSVGSEVPANETIDACLMYKERLDLVPSFYSYTVKSCLLPIRKVQNALVTLYFHHIHPMFPVVDEYHISELHRKYRGKEEIMDPSDFTIYHAIMVAGFAVGRLMSLRKTQANSNSSICVQIVLALPFPRCGVCRAVLQHLRNVVHEDFQVELHVGLDGTRDYRG